ncbi:Hsp20/alpha crystallin family protein [Tessaracoccus sp.]|uniref:Hsp20/alpha crystallin family protein n=1 Tax=Tessaracoccus sp. TaxID=1971211 RepID=UPI0034502F51
MASPSRSVPSGSSPNTRGVQWITREREAASFLRQLELGCKVDTERITAAYNNGVLSVTIPDEREGEAPQNPGDELRRRADDQRTRHRRIGPSRSTPGACHEAGDGLGFWPSSFL